jgi:hypothetical protein
MAVGLPLGVDRRRFADRRRLPRLRFRLCCHVQNTPGHRPG